MIALRPMEPGDWTRVVAILAEGIATGNATFETTVPTWEAWDASHLREGRLLAETRPAARASATRGSGTGSIPAESHPRVVGWAALAPVSSRCVYSGVAEVSVYVAASSRGRGVGRVLLHGLVEASERAGIWTLQAGIFPENEASRRLHLAEGFREVGRRERIGHLGGRWRDVVLLERRSDVVGSGTDEAVPG
jgi:L-amino acid N-acyltransferase YncA